MQTGTVKMLEIQAYIENLCKIGSATPVFEIMACAGNDMRWLDNAYVTTNYLHWVAKRMAQDATNEGVLAAEPPKISRWLWPARWFYQKMVCFWRYRVLQTVLNNHRVTFLFSDVKL